MAQGFVTYKWSIVGQSWSLNSPGVLRLWRESSEHSYSGSGQRVAWHMSLKDELRLTNEVSQQLRSQLLQNKDVYPATWKGRSGSADVICNVRYRDWPEDHWSLNWHTRLVLQLQEYGWLGSKTALQVIVEGVPHKSVALYDDVCPHSLNPPSRRT